MCFFKFHVGVEALAARARGCHVDVFNKFIIQIGTQINCLVEYTHVHMCQRVEYMSIPQRLHGV